MKSRKFKKKLKKLAVQHLLKISDLQIELESATYLANSSTMIIADLRSQIALLKEELNILHSEYDLFRSKSMEVLDIEDDSNSQLELPMSTVESQPYTIFEYDEPEDCPN